MWSERVGHNWAIYIYIFFYSTHSTDTQTHTFAHIFLPRANNFQSFNQDVSTDEGIKWVRTSLLRTQVSYVDFPTA